MEWTICLWIILFHTRGHQKEDLWQCSWPHGLAEAYKKAPSSHNSDVMGKRASVMNSDRPSHLFGFARFFGLFFFFIILLFIFLFFKLKWKVSSLYCRFNSNPGRALTNMKIKRLLGIVFSAFVFFFSFFLNEKK